MLSFISEKNIALSTSTRLFNRKIINNSGGWINKYNNNEMNIQMRLPSLLMISMQLFSIEALTKKRRRTGKNTKKKWLI